MGSVTKRGEDRYFARVRLKGFASVYETHPTMKDARAWVKHTEAEMQRGAWQPRTAGEGGSLGDALNRYRREISATKRGVVKENSVIKGLTSEKISGRAIVTIRGADVANLRDAWLKRGLASATVNRRLAVLAHVFSVAVKEWGYPLQNPVAMIRKPKINNARQKRISETEERYLLTACKEHVTGWLHSAVILLIETGMRRGELVGLHWDAVDLAARTVSLTRTKSGKPRIIALSRRAIEALLSMVRHLHDPRIVPVAQGDAITAAFATAVGRARASYRADCEAKGQPVDAAFLAGVCVHTLRHEAISRFMEMGLTAAEAASQSGHATASMLARYSHAAAAPALLKKIDAAHA